MAMKKHEIICDYCGNNEWFTTNTCPTRFCPKCNKELDDETYKTLITIWESLISPEIYGPPWGCDTDTLKDRWK